MINTKPAKHRHVPIVTVSISSRSSKHGFRMMSDDAEHQRTNTTSPGTYIVGHSQVIEDAQDHAETHVDDPDDHGHLHLVGVEEGQSVDSQAPYLEY